MFLKSIIPHALSFCVCLFQFSLTKSEIRQQKVCGAWCHKSQGKTKLKKSSGPLVVARWCFPVPYTTGIRRSLNNALHEANTTCTKVHTAHLDSF
jgi:hypothetical protein